jgi:predicted glutamine amidotransferase
MCELLGVSVVPAARLGIYFHEFRSRAADNREGWGLAWWSGGEAVVRKEALAAHESEVAARLADDHPAREMFIAHVRAATVGALTDSNAHPFRARALGRDWVFAHNGTVLDLDRLDSGGFEPDGETDSEQAFHHLLTRIERRARGEAVASLPDEVLAAEVLAAGRELSERDSRVNFLLSDGTTLYAYHDGHKTLHVLEAHAPGGARRVVVASVPLTDEPGWRRLVPGEFLTVRAGRVEHVSVPIQPVGGLTTSL